MNLDNLRKQAKQYARWHRDRHGTVAEVIRNALPRYAGLSDSQIFEEAFRLADAQELVARREGSLAPPNETMQPPSQPQ